MLLAVPNGRMASGIGRPANETAAPHGSVPSGRDGEIDGVIESSCERRGIVDQVHDVVARPLDLVNKIVVRETVARVLVVHQ